MRDDRVTLVNKDGKEISNAVHVNAAARRPVGHERVNQLGERDNSAVRRHHAAQLVLGHHTLKKN